MLRHCELRLCIAIHFKRMSWNMREQNICKVFAEVVELNIQSGKGAQQYTNKS